MIITFIYYYQQLPFDLTSSYFDVGLGFIWCQWIDTKTPTSQNYNSLIASHHPCIRGYCQYCPSPLPASFISSKFVLFSLLNFCNRTGCASLLKNNNKFQNMLINKTVPYQFGRSPSLIEEINDEWNGKYSQHTVNYPHIIICTTPQP